MAIKYVKCRAKHCLHMGEPINKDEAIRDGKSYYHPDCYQIKEDIAEIIDLWVTKINKNSPYALLTRTINNIIYDKNIESGHLLYGIKYYINHKIPLTYPAGMYYVIQNKKVEDEYYRFKLSQIPKQKTVSNDIETEADFTYTPTKKKGLEDIFK